MVRRIRWGGASQPGLARLCLRRVLAKRCPQCGQGPLYTGWARLGERCDVCGLLFRREPGAELGAMTLSTILNTSLAAAAFLAIWSLTDLGGWGAFWLTTPVVLVACYALSPLCMSLWVAVEYLTDVGNQEWWARPRR